MLNIVFCYDMVVVGNEVVLISNGNIMTISRIVIEMDIIQKDILHALNLFQNNREMAITQYA